MLRPALLRKITSSTVWRAPPLPFANRTIRILLGCLVTLAIGVVGREHFVSPGLELPLFIGSDSFAHAHRVRSFASALPWPALVDPYHFYPEGNLNEWPLLFDYGVALLVAGPGRLLGDLAARAALLPWICLAIGAMTVALFGELATRRLGPLRGLVATLALAGNLAFHSVTAYGELDHHAAEVLAVVLLLFVPAALDPLTDRRRAVSLGLALALVASCSTVSAYLVSAALALGAIGQRIGPADVGSRQLAGFGAALLVPLLLVGGGEAWLRSQPWSLHTLSLVQPALAGGGLALVALARAGRRRVAVAGLLVGALLLTLLLPGPAAWALGFVSGGSPFWGNLSEAQPLFLGPEGPTLELGHLFFGLAFLALPVAVLELRRQGPAALWRDAGWFVLLLFFCAFAQKRFAHLLAPGLILLTIGFLSRIAERFRLPGWTAVLAVVALFGEPMLAGRHAYGFAPSAGTRDAVRVVEILRTLPETDAAGVSAPPNLGNAIVWLARRPVVTSTFFYPRYQAFDLALREAQSVDELIKVLAGRRAP